MIKTSINANNLMEQFKVINNQSFKALGKQHPTKCQLFFLKHEMHGLSLLSKMLMLL